MVFFNHATRQMTAKIVYYGPGLCGKTTNLNAIYAKTSSKARGEMVSLNTETDRTLFFDLLPMDVGMIGGFKAKLQLYTVPGQVFYNSTRKLVLKGVDGIVFVVDSQTAMLEASRESLQNLEDNLRELGLEIGDIPMVFQWNKRDLKNVVPVPQLERELNPRQLPSFESIAQDGTGVFETLRGVTKLALSQIKSQHLGELNAPREAAKPAPVEPPPVAEAGPTPPQALSFSDLPSVSEMLEEEADRVEAPDFPEPPEPLPDEDREEKPAPVPPARIPEPAPAPAPTIQVAAHPPSPKTQPIPVIPKFTIQPHAPSPSTRTKNPNPQAAINTLLGELTQVGRLGSPSTLKVELPADCTGDDIEVVVQIRQRDQVIAEGHLKRPVPAKGIAAKLNLELKRS
jgi:signal recognition particle receptor subunit beta